MWRGHITKREISGGQKSLRDKLFLEQNAHRTKCQCNIFIRQNIKCKLCREQIVLRTNCPENKLPLGKKYSKDKISQKLLLSKTPGLNWPRTNSPVCPVLFMYIMYSKMIKVFFCFFWYDDTFVLINNEKCVSYSNGQLSAFTLTWIEAWVTERYV